MSALTKYYAALDRLIEGKPIRVPLGSKINKDTVAMEAGNKRGSIKSSRASYSDLVVDIERASMKAIPKEKLLQESLRKAKAEISEVKAKYLASLNRELLLNRRVNELEAIVSSENVKVITRK